MDSIFLKVYYAACRVDLIIHVGIFLRHKHTGT